MIYRENFIKRLATRSFENLSDDQVIYRQYSVSDPDGPLNSAKSITYQNTLIENCDVKIRKEKKETDTGAEIYADALVFIKREEFNITIDERDLVNIGGTINGNDVTGGIDYRIDKFQPFDLLIKFELLRL